MKISYRLKPFLAALCALVFAFGFAACNNGNINSPNKDDVGNETPPPSGDDKNYADVFIFMGQSNMAGRGEAADAIPCGEGHGYEFRAVAGNDEDGWLYPVSEPFGKTEDNEALHDDSGGANKKSGGMVSSFCEAYYEETGVPVVAVSASVGGTSITQWTPGTDYYKESARRLKACLDYLDGKSDFEVRNINMVWCQGESDGYADTNNQRDYISLLESIVSGMKLSLLSEGRILEACFIVTFSEYDGNQLKSFQTALVDKQIKLCGENDNFVLASMKFRGVPEEMRDDPHFHQGIYNVVGWDAGKNTADYLENGVQPQCKPYIEGEAKELADKYGVTLRYNEGGAVEDTKVASGGYADALLTPGKWYLETRLDTGTNKGNPDPKASADYYKNVFAVKSDGTNAKTLTFFCQPDFSVGTKYRAEIRISASTWGQQSKALQFGTGTGYSAGDTSGNIETAYDAALVGQAGEKTFYGTFTVSADKPFFFTLSTYANPIELEIVFTAL